MSVAANEMVKVKDPLPGDLAIWFFIMAEMLVFGVYIFPYRIDFMELFCCNFVVGR